MEMTGAQIIVECLKREGVKIIFGIPGGVTLPMFDVLYDSPIRFVLTKHEQGATHMADAYARASGRVGVCTATSGPGATNLVTGLATAYMDSSPIIAITSQVRSDVIGSDAFQEADATGIMRPVTKHNYLVKDPRDLVRVIREAFLIASTGRPGPVHIDIPVDIQRAKTEFKWIENISIRSYRPKLEGHPLQIKKAADLIASAQRPLLYAGGGVIGSDTAEVLRKLAEKADMPVATTLMGNGAIPFDHPLYIGMLGMHGKYVCNKAIQSCDLLVACGVRFDDRVTGKLSAFSPHSKKIHIDIDPSSIGKNVMTDVPVVGDLRNVLPRLLEAVQKKSHPEWKKQLKQLDQQHPMAYKDDDKKGYVKPQYVIDKLHQMTKGEALVTTGVGQHQMWAMQWYAAKRPRHFITSGGLGTMGYGFPAAIGAKMARPEDTVVCIDGDGSFQMMMTEMATAVRENVKIIVIVFNNCVLGMVRQWQDLFYNQRFAATYQLAPGGRAVKGAEPDPKKTPYVPDFMKWAEAYGILGIRVNSRNQVESALKQAFKSDKSVLIEVSVHQSEKVMPMVPAGASLDEIILDMA
ncbi:MAG TPA: biosynthetic-type acetolactate synthase large subunit [Elusimicrobiota bacterium]|nr:biosynthetic-type acetolactate synthase large subunit [Elusimicrobiota bacterium]